MCVNEKHINPKIIMHIIYSTFTQHFTCTEDKSIYIWFWQNKSIISEKKIVNFIMIKSYSLNTRYCNFQSLVKVMTKTLFFRNSKDLEIASGQEAAAAKAGQREGKFLLYWMTTTSTTTTTTYTATASLSALECTPTSWTYTLCG